MGTLRQAAELRKPPGMCLVPVTAFSHDYYDRPDDTICIGLRLISDGELNTARSAAQKWADKSHQYASTDDRERLDLWIECFNDALIRWIVARGTCDPNNIDLPPDPWNQIPEDQVRDALTSEGVRFIYDEWEKMRVTSDPTRRDAGDPEVLSAIPKLLPFANKLAPLRRSRLRRLLAFVIDELVSVAPIEVLGAPVPTCAKCSAVLSEIGPCSACSDGGITTD